jgi:hypothetical protein
MPSQNNKDVESFNKAAATASQQKKNNIKDNNKNSATKKGLLVLVIAIGAGLLFSAISFYRTKFGDVAEKRQNTKEKMILRDLDLNCLNSRND